MEEVLSLTSSIDVYVAHVNPPSSPKVKQHNVAPIVALSPPQKPPNTIVECKSPRFKINAS